MPEAKRPIRVFLCHASQDKPAVRVLYQHLKKEGWIDPWLDEEKLTLGQHWTSVIEDALDAADVVVIFLSKNSVQKEGFVQRELNYAWDISLEKPRNVIFLIPFRLDDCEVPRHLRSRHWGDYFGKEKERTYQTLLHSLRLRHEQKLKLEESEYSYQEQELENKPASSEAIVTDIISIGDDLDSAQPVPDFLLPKAVESEVIKAPKEKGKRETAEKPKPRASKSKPIDQPARKPSKVESKPTDTRNTRRKSGTRVVFWGIGLIAVVFVVSMLAFNNAFKPQVAVPTPPQTPSPTMSLTSTLAITPTNTVVPISADLPTEITDAKGVSMVLVPAGEFTMGSENGDSDEQPVHQIFLDAFYMDIYEVTNGLYRICMDVEICAAPAYMNTDESYSNRPVGNITWQQANTYCEWRGGRLPTEAEWEKSARGSDGRTYPWGEEIDCSYTNYGSCGYVIADVGTFERDKSPYSIFDLGGNVEEWVADWYSLSYYFISPLENPTGPAFGNERVSRGGSVSINQLNHLKSSNRIHHSLTYNRWYLGFRCAKDAEQ